MKSIWPLSLALCIMAGCQSLRGGGGPSSLAPSDAPPPPPHSPRQQATGQAVSQIQSRITGIEATANWDRVALWCATGGTVALCAWVVWLSHRRAMMRLRADQMSLLQDSLAEGEAETLGTSVQISGPIGYRPADPEETA